MHFVETTACNIRTAVMTHAVLVGDEIEVSQEIVSTPSIGWNYRKDGQQIECQG